MKISLVVPVIASFASGALARPSDFLPRSWISSKDVRKASCAMNEELCFKVCWPEQPKCPPEWNPKNYGSDYDPCWTCCKTIDDGDDEIETRMKANKAIGRPIHVQTNNNPRRAGTELMVYYKDQIYEATVSKKEVRTTEEYCLAWCYSQTPPWCPDGWAPKIKGNCGTCCRDY